jgi:hypothetical protein
MAYGPRRVSPPIAGGRPQHTWRLGGILIDYRLRPVSQVTPRPVDPRRLPGGSAEWDTNEETTPSCPNGAMDDVVSLQCQIATNWVESVTTQR